MTQLFIILFAYFVQFTDKMGSNRVALSDIALEKRTTRGIAIDSLDYAVSPIYIDSLRQTGSRIYHTSRWMNGATIETDSNTIQRIAQWFALALQQLVADSERNNQHHHRRYQYPRPYTWTYRL